MRPRISVLMPTYNVARYLPEAIESILDQTYADFEFIIVDDCSTDETPEVLSYYTRRDARIQLLRSERNLGRAGARNKALSANPSGEFIAVMDSDDICLPERFEKQISFLDVHPEVVVVGAQVMNVDEHDNPTAEQTRLPETHGSLVWTLLYSMPFCHPVVMMRSGAVWSTGSYQDDSAVEDAEFMSRIAYFGRFANLSEVLLHYRMPSERLVCRMADWSIPLRQVSRSFVENLVGRNVDIRTAACLYHSVFYDPGLHVSGEEALQTIILIQDAFEAMRSKGLLLVSDTKEVEEIMLSQFRMLLSYTRQIQ